MIVYVTALERIHWEIKAANNYGMSLDLVRQRASGCLFIYACHYNKYKVPQKVSRMGQYGSII